MLLIADDGDLIEQGKLHSVVQFAKGLNLLVGSRLLSLEVVGREAGDNQSLALVLLVDLFQRFILRGQTAL
jgi:hypothetical protein